MRKFKYDDGTEGVEYETLSELLNLPNIKVTEYGDCYYVTIMHMDQEPRYVTIYEVDKKTRRASYYWDKIGYMLDIMDKATPVDPATLKRAV